jgi:hypothetical protein
MRLKNYSVLLALNIFFLLFSDSPAQMFWNQTSQFAGTNTSYVSIPSTSGTNITSDFTAEAWINPSSVSVTEKGILSKGSVLGVSMRYALRISTTGKITVYTNGILRLTSAATIVANTWTHVAATFNSTTDSFAIYVNGVKKHCYSSSRCRTVNQF